MDIITKHLRVHGKVQGVGYRMWTVETAQDMGLSGWVRNRTDLTVEILVKGPKDIVLRFIDRCYQGPDAAKVETIDIEDSDYDGAGFVQRFTC